MHLTPTPKSSGFGCDDQKHIEVQFVLLQNFSLVSFAGAVDALITANLILPNLFRYSTVGVGSQLMKSDLGIDVSTDVELVPTSVRDNTDQQFQILVVCGGYRCSLQEAPALSDYLKAADNRGVQLCSLWNGAVHLAHAGLLNDHKCAIHPENHAFINEFFPKVMLSKNNFYVSEERASCAGPVSAIEMMLGIVSQNAGENIVRAIREIISCDKQPEHQDSTPLQFNDNNALPSSLKEILQLMRNNIEEPLNFKEISHLVNLSTRQVERLFQNHFGTTPSRYYLGIRVDYARQLLMQSQKNILDVALASGFVTTSHFSTCFKKIYGISPKEARNAASAEKTAF